IQLEPELSATTRSAEQLARWLLTQHHNPKCQLGSVELLVTSSLDTMDWAHGDSRLTIEAPDMDHVKAAFHRWYERCHSHEDNIALFYFAGHGLSWQGDD